MAKKTTTKSVAKDEYHRRLDKACNWMASATELAERDASRLVERARSFLEFVQERLSEA